MLEVTLPDCQVMAVKILHGHDKLNPKLLIGFQFNEGRQHKKLTGSELDDFAWLV